MVLRVSLYFSNKGPAFFAIPFLCVFLLNPLCIPCSGEGLPKMPLDMEALKRDLSYARGAAKSDMGWPRNIEYGHEVCNLKKETPHEEKNFFVIANKPLRIIPHAVGVSEILWAICPRDRIIAFNEVSADPEYSFIADLVKKQGPVFKSKQTELVIGYEPDLVLTVFYSGATFKEKLKEAKIPYLDLGYFGSLESVKRQALLVGRVIGEEGNAEALVEVIDGKIQELRGKIPDMDKPKRVLYYDEGGYVPGESSNFQSICNIIRVVNVGTEQGITSWSRIDYETLLKWNPDIIIVSEESDLKGRLMANEILSHAKAIKEGKVYGVPGCYLNGHSQYVVLSANLLAGIVYEGVF